jgi:hypothetical protein
MVDTVIVTSPDTAIAVLQPTLTDAIAAAQMYATQVAAAQAIVLAAQAGVNAAETAALSAAASALSAASAAAAAAGGGGISTTVAALNALPGLIEGLPGWATNGRKIGEGPGSGTGVAVRYSLGSWRCVSTDAPVQA